jgi:hypothetical protein
MVYICNNLSTVTAHHDIRYKSLISVLSSEIKD